MNRAPINPWVVAFTVTIAAFMELLDTSIANVALPHIAGGLSASQDESTWVLTSYLVSNAIVIPLSAWLMGTMGQRRFYMACVTVFTVSSVACGFAPTLGSLVFFRVLQGIGGGGLAPSAQAVLVDSFPAERRATAFTVYSLTVIAAPAAGPVLGGWLTDHWSWRWAFLINAPVGVAALMLSSRYLHDPEWLMEKIRAARLRGLRARVDYVGIGLIAVGLGCLQVVLDKGQEDDWFGSPFIQVFAVLAILGLVGGTAWAWFRTEAAVDLSLLRERNFAIACALYFGSTLVLYASTLLLPVLMQGLFGYTATDAGLCLSPGAAVLLVLTVLAARLVRKVGAKPLLIFGVVVIAVSGAFMAAVVQPSLSYGMAILPRIVMGVGLAAFFVPNSLIAYSRLPREKNNKASSLTQLFRNLGGSVGIALGATYVARRSQAHLAMLTLHVSAYDPWGSAALDSLTNRLASAGLSVADAAQRARAMLFASVSRQADFLAYRDAFYLLAVIGLVCVPLAFFVRPARGPAPQGAH